jgi:hypothetical protein
MIKRERINCSESERLEGARNSNFWDERKFFGSAPDPGLFQEAVPLTLFFSIKEKQCCGSEMFIPDPDFYPSRIPDPKKAKKNLIKTSKWQTAVKTSVYLISFLDKFVELGLEDTLQFVHDVG